jgi:hypothetical protein
MKSTNREIHKLKSFLRSCLYWDLSIVGNFSIREMMWWHMKTPNKRALKNIQNVKKQGIQSWGKINIDISNFNILQRYINSKNHLVIPDIMDDFF